MEGKNLLFLFFFLISLSWTPSRIKYKTCHKGRGAPCEQTAIHIWCQLHLRTSSCSCLPFLGGWWWYLYSDHHKIHYRVCLLIQISSFKFAALWSPESPCPVHLEYHMFHPSPFHRSPYVFVTHCFVLPSPAPLVVCCVLCLDNIPYRESSTYDGVPFLRRVVTRFST